MPSREPLSKRQGGIFVIDLARAFVLGELLAETLLRVGPLE
jgi:hypothetical protein